MTNLPRRIAISTPVACSVAIAALLSATFFPSPSTVAGTAGPSIQIAQAAPSPAAADPASNSAETVEMRITNLHTELKITPEEESKWNNVAQAMRENAAALAKLAADRTTVAPQGMTAIDDLKGYQKFAQAHVDGLKNLLGSFETLYTAFPEPQKKNADEVFQSFGKKGQADHT